MSRDWLSDLIQSSDMHRARAPEFCPSDDVVPLKAILTFNGESM